jgi:hypothetical protein
MKPELLANLYNKLQVSVIIHTSERTVSSIVRQKVLWQVQPDDYPSTTYLEPQ